MVPPIFVTRNAASFWVNRTVHPQAVEVMIGGSAQVSDGAGHDDD
jgi:hypothetical protein